MINSTFKIFRQHFINENYKLGKKWVGHRQNCSTKLENENIYEAILLQPKLSAIPQQMWYKTYETFVSYGLTTKDFLKIIVKNPTVLTRSSQSNIECIERWRSCQFGEKLLNTLLTTYPELLNATDERKILKRTTFLKGFVTTNKNVWKLLMNCPNLLEEPEEVIEEKMYYILHTMRVDLPEIVKSEALKKSLNEVHCRHVFLERLNLFKPRSLKDDNKQTTNNHRLHEIMDTSDTSFTLNVAQVSFGEYETFRELFKKEIQQKHENNIDDDLN